MFDPGQHSHTVHKTAGSQQVRLGHGVPALLAWGHRIVGMLHVTYERIAVWEVIRHQELDAEHQDVSRKSGGLLDVDRREEYRCHNEALP